jgi:quercetin dioxygenase-like cupin family protein
LAASAAITLGAVHGGHVTKQAQAVFQAAETGELYWGPGDSYRFLVTGEESNGSYFILDCLVGPGGGPPPHRHRREEESFYLLEGELTVTMEDRTLQMKAGDFVHFPRGTIHSFRNEGTGFARMLATFSPAGMEGWFRAAYDQAPTARRHRRRQPRRCCNEWARPPRGSGWNSSDRPRHVARVIAPFTDP